MSRMLTLVLLCAVTLPAAADWVLDGDGSRMSFVSVKAGNVAEVHQFRTLEGRVDDAGTLRVAIDLASVDTAIPIRNQRMREMLFEVARFPEAVVTASIDEAWIEGLAPGESRRVAAEAVLALHGVEQPLTVELLLARLTADALPRSWMT